MTTLLTLLSGFAALSMISGALLSLLPDGSMRHTASMAVGLMMLLYWADGVRQLLAALPAPEQFAGGVLASTGVTLPALEASLLTEVTP